VVVAVLPENNLLGRRHQLRHLGSPDLQMTLPPGVAHPHVLVLRAGLVLVVVLVVLVVLLLAVAPAWSGHGLLREKHLEELVVLLLIFVPLSDHPQLRPDAV
jgi:hypothetical protein